MLPLAPARLSTTTVCPRVSLSGVAIWRATKSSPPPAPDDTINRTGFVGYAARDCAAPWGAATNSAAASPAPTADRNAFFIAPPGLPNAECSVLSPEFLPPPRRCAPPRLRQAGRSRITSHDWRIMELLFRLDARLPEYLRHLRRLAPDTRLSRSLHASRLVHAQYAHTTTN